MKRVNISVGFAVSLMITFVALSCSFGTNNVKNPAVYNPDTSPRIDSFDVGVAGARVVINDRDGTIVISVPVGTPAILTPSIQYRGDAIHPESGIMQDFSQSVSYRVTNHAGDALRYEVSFLQYTPSAPGSLILEASRDSGIGPLSVMFSAKFPDENDAGTWFHEYEYLWNFGDSDCGAWNTTKRSKNTAKGPIAGHVFETPGSYLVNLTVSDGSGIIDSASVSITVSDPAVYYAGTKTVCVSPDSDFSGAPFGSSRITTSDLSTVAPLAVAGTRILLRRGASWSVSGIGELWPDNDGPVTVGAFGSGDRPLVTVSGGNFLDIADKRDWRIMDIDLSDSSKANGTFGGTTGMQRILFLRVRSRGFHDGIAWSHWIDSGRVIIDQMAIVDSEFLDAAENVGYVGAERLMILGNIFSNADTSHVLRVWQAYDSVIGENLMSGSSISSGDGRHALKLHGPGEREIGSASGSGQLAHRTSYVVVSGNVFGTSGPWPVNIAPQNAASDERLSHIIFERNQYFAGYGTAGPTPLQIGIRIVASDVTVRNNIIDGRGWGTYFTGISVEQDGVVPAPQNVAIYNNTVYKEGVSDAPWIGIQVGSGVISSIVMNNLVCFPGDDYHVAFMDRGVSRSSGGNTLERSKNFLDPDNPDSLSRNFRLLAASLGIDGGVSVPVFDDYYGNPRPLGLYFDAGAVEGVYYGAH